MKTFRHILGNTLATTVVNFFVWFALVFWLYLETQSVLATSIAGGIYAAASALSGFWFGSIVDHNKKKTAMLISSICTAIFFLLALGIYILTPKEAFTSVTNPMLWVFALTAFAGIIISGIRNITLPITVTMLIEENKRDKANGLTGMVMGISGSGAGIASGVVLAYAGMAWILIVGIVITLCAIVHLTFVSIPEAEIVRTKEKARQIDIKGTITAIRAIPGLFALIFLTTFNNFLGGVFMALLDAYGLTLMSVEAWGILWGILCLNFIAGGLFIAKWGLGKNPLRNLFVVNIVMWISCIIFPLQPSIFLLAAGICVWLFFGPYIEAIEHTIVQKVVPLERQGRVFGFAQSVETAAMPLTAFLIGPIAQFIFIPFMTTGAGVGLIGDWFGVGPGRGIALVFILTSTIGLTATLIAMHLKPYKLLAQRYLANSNATSDGGAH